MVVSSSIDDHARCDVSQDLSHLPCVGNIHNIVVESDDGGARRREDPLDRRTQLTVGAKKRNLHGYWG